MIVEAKFKRELISTAHHLKPVVMLGQNGLTNNVLSEIDRALNDHELIKVKVSGDRLEKNQIAQDISMRLNAEFLRLIGNNLIFYRELSDDQ